MSALIEFFGSPAWTAAVFLGAALGALLALYFTEGETFRMRAVVIGIVLSAYLLLVLLIRGIILIFF